MRLATYRAASEAILFYPVYALRFADAGLSAAQISALFAIWSVTSFVLEIPAGLLADLRSRRRLVAGGELLRACGFALWACCPTFIAFAVGFVLWGCCGALSSGAVEALVYDELDAYGATDRYLRVTGRAATASLLVMLAATGLATPVLHIGGYPAIGVASVVACLLTAVAALRLPEPPRRHHGEGYRDQLRELRDGLLAAARHPRVRVALVLAAAVPAFASIDEYLPLLARAQGTPTTWVPVLLLPVWLAMALGSLMAGRVPARRLSRVLAAAAVLLAAGALAGHPVGMLPVAAGLGLAQLAQLGCEARVQEEIEGAARATALSVAGFGAEVGALALYGGYGVGSRWLGTPALVALLALPLATLAALAALTRHRDREAGEPCGDREVDARRRPGP